MRVEDSVRQRAQLLEQIGWVFLLGDFGPHFLSGEVFRLYWIAPVCESGDYDLGISASDINSLRVRDDPDVRWFADAAELIAEPFIEPESKDETPTGGENCVVIVRVDTTPCEWNETRVWHCLGSTVLLGPTAFYGRDTQIRVDDEVAGSAVHIFCRAHGQTKRAFPYFNQGPSSVDGHQSRVD
ncbi:MAG: hypothetical protein Q7S40_29330 [Opitutaceae bacterium]|nr:hypothetical protein [Opitutaceae bacterium]